MAEIPYGFKNLWQIDVSSYNLATLTFLASNVTSVTLNGNTVSVEQMIQLFDYSRDMAGIIQPETSGLLITINSYDKETGLFHFVTLVAQDFEITGVLGVSGDMVDNTSPQRPIILHDVQKLDVAQYQSDTSSLNARLTIDEQNIQTNSDSIANLQSSVITAINVNGVPATVSQNQASISFDVVGHTELTNELNKKVDKNIAGAGNTIVQELTTAIDENTRELSITKTKLSLETGVTNESQEIYNLAEVLGITKLEGIDKQLLYYVDNANITTFDIPIAVQLSNLYQYASNGTFYAPQSTSDIKLVFGISRDNSGYGQLKRLYISSIGIVHSTTESNVNTTFTNLDQFSVYNRYNGYRNGTIVYDPVLTSTFQVLQTINEPTSEADTIPISNSQYYKPIRDYTMMEPDTLWANVGDDINAGDAVPISDARIKFINNSAGYSQFIKLINETASLPLQILNDSDWNNNISVWVVDGMEFTSLTNLVAYMNNFNLKFRYALSNVGIVSFSSENNSLEIYPEYTQDIITQRLSSIYQPIPSVTANGNISVYDDSNILVDSGRALNSIPTFEQGQKADTAIQSVTIETGSTNGTIILTVDGNQYTVPIAGLGTAAYTNTDAYATPAQGEKADTAIQTIVVQQGPNPGTIQYSINSGAFTTVPVNGLGTAAYVNADTLATRAQGNKADSAVQTIEILPGIENGTIRYTINGGNERTVAITGLGSAAFANVSDFPTLEQGAKADTALQPTDVVDNLTSTATQLPVSANQARILHQLYNQFAESGKPIGGFNTLANAYTNTSQYASDLQPINIGDTIYIASDENHTNQPARYKVASIDGSGNIVYSFVRIEPDSSRDFSLNPLQPDEIANGVINTNHIQNYAIQAQDMANESVLLSALSAELQESITKANNSLQSNVQVEGSGDKVVSVTQNSDKTITIMYGNTVLNPIVSGNGDFFTDITINRLTLEFIKNGIALQNIVNSGSGNVITDLNASGRDLIATFGTMLSAINTIGDGNVITDISQNGNATKGNMLQNAVKSGSGNVLTGVNVANNVATFTSGNVLTNITNSGSGNVISDITANGGTLNVNKISAITSIPTASTAQSGIAQLNDTVTSTSITQAVTARVAKMLYDLILSNDSLYIKLSGNQSIPAILTMLNDLIVPAKTTLPTIPSSTTYATEAQVNTRIPRPSTAAQSNIAVFDINRNTIDSGIPVSNVNAVNTKEPLLNNVASKGTPVNADSIYIRDSTASNTTKAVNITNIRPLFAPPYNGLAYGLCSTAAGTTAKTVSIPNFIRYTGAIVGVLFNAYNTAVAPTLNVQSTGAGRIYYDGSTFMPNMITAGIVYLFQWDGSAWRIINPTIINIETPPSGDSSTLIANTEWTKRELTASIRAENILHNWDFRNPVNQRGQTSYSGARYGIDRWTGNTNTKLTLSNDCIILNAVDTAATQNINFRQYFEKTLPTDIYTLSAIVRGSGTMSLVCANSSGNTIEYTQVTLTGNWQTVSLTKTIANMGSVIIQLLAGNGSLTVQSVKLEKGEFSTLINDPPMDYGTELLKCQRYSYYTGTATRWIRASLLNANEITFDVPCPNNMRVNPTLSGTITLREFGGSAQNGFTFTTSGVNEGAIRVLASKPSHGLSDATLNIVQGMFDANL